MNLCCQCQLIKNTRDEGLDVFYPNNATSLQ